MGAGWAGILAIESVRAALVPQELLAVTDNVSAVVPVVNEAVMAFVP